MLRAREVLADCELALADFEAAGPTPYWRTRWTGLVALLRCVGHVLHKVDAGSSGDLKKAIATQWDTLSKSKPEPRIFWEFIEEERNNILKAYEFGARMNTTVRPGAAHLSLSGEGSEGPGGPTTYESFIRSGTFAERDALEICRDAITFWRVFLDKVEASVST
jgi:hypothetical protein